MPTSETLTVAEILAAHHCSLCAAGIGHDADPAPAPKRPKLIRTRRSCIGCGLRPGELYSNGLCDPCQNPKADTYAPIGNEA